VIIVVIHDVHDAMDIRRIDLNLLVLFEAVYRLRNLTAAGESLGLSQPAMSHALRRLRDMLQDPLFVRLPKGLQPTPFAENLASQVTQGLGVLRGALDKAEFVPATSSRLFRIVMTDIGEYVFVPALSRRLEALAPQVTLETLQLPVKELKEAMANGEVDLAMGFVPRLGAGFHQQRLFSDHYVCMVRRDHRDIRSTLTLKQYLGATHALIASEGTGHGERIERALLDRNPSARIALRMNRFLAMPAVIENTDMLVTLPNNLAESFRLQFKVRVLPVPFDLPGYEVNQFWHERYHLESGNRWLRKTLAELFTPPPAKRDTNPLKLQGRLA
jgi:DNA-binding transcriptional LysR family regulator